jgi:hypothetical protein
MKRDSRRISDLRLEQYALGELPRDDSENIRRALEKDEILRQRLEALEKSNREILSVYEPGEMAAAIQGRLGRREKGFRGSPAFFGTMIPVAAALLVFFSVFVLRERFMPAGDTRPKGSTAVSVFLKTSDGATELANGAIGHPGDWLQIAYTAGDARYGVIFSIDGRGVVTFHLPQHYSSQRLVSPDLELQGRTVLPFSYELDDAPGFERFFFVYSRDSFDVSTIARAARALATHPQTADKDTLALPPQVGVATLLIEKQVQK